jgi:hypothetical protein
MSTSRKFDLEDILSVTTDVIVSGKGMEAVNQLFDFVLIGIDREECTETIFRQHEQLRGVDVPPGTVIKIWMSEQIQRFGRQLPISRPDYVWLLVYTRVEPSGAKPRKVEEPYPTKAAALDGHKTNMDEYGPECILAAHIEPPKGSSIILKR